ncbi:MAG: hypothetical protein NZM12_13410 [Steroidobacteraceae bacterium]|nr:hypothetical protein [Steroidobacteraceae bacterium]
MRVALGLLPDHQTARKLLRAYSQWGRHYHNRSHLESVLSLFDRYRELADRPAEVECALWFHDAVYRTWRSDNEERSAAWADRFLRAGRGTGDIRGRIVEHILATKHAGLRLATNCDTALVLDIDLAILGADQQTYQAYASNLRREYWWLPAARYRRGRLELLERLLALPQIFHHPMMRAVYESAARRNLAAELAALSGR